MHMFRTLAFLLTAGASALAAGASRECLPVACVARTGPAIAETVQEHIALRVNDGRTIGIVVGLIDETGVTYFSRGVRACEGEPVDEFTIFEIGSITKVFTAMLLTDAALTGALQLDDPIAKHLPIEIGFPVRGERIATLADLATHRSGLPRMPSNFRPAVPRDPYADYTIDRLYDFVKDARLARDPGSGYEYSNIGFGLLGHVIERAAETTYEKLVRDRIANPLGITETACSSTGAMRARAATGHASGAPTSDWHFDTMVGAGGLRSTPTDLVRFLQAWMHIDQSPVGAIMHTCLDTRFPTEQPDLDIALGWHISKRDGFEIIWHNGGTGGFRSFAGFRSDRSRGVVVLSNSSEVIDDIGWHLLDSTIPLNTIEPVATRP